MGGGGGGSFIDPPPGPPLRSLPEAANLSSTAGIVEVALQAKASVIEVAGTQANLLTYNDLYPGPVIRARRGDLLRVHFHNHLPHSMESNLLGHDRYTTNLHTHGLHVSPIGSADNVMLHFMPGESFPYEYDLAWQKAGTLNFYHPHVHGTVAEQYWAGMVGPLVIEDEVEDLADFETHLLVLKDLTLVGTDPEPYISTMDYMHGKEGTLVMVNGQVNPVLAIRPRQVQRWRVLNASNARYYRLSLENHAMHVIGSDGGLLDRPYPVGTLLLAPGERADILVRADRSSGDYRLLALPYDRGGMSSTQQATLMTVKYAGSRTAQLLPQIVNPEARRLDLDLATLPRRQITLSMHRGRGYVNGISFTDMESASRITSRMGGYEVWEIINQSGMDHPFHQHVNAAQVLAVSGGDSGYASLYTTAPAWKDTVNIPRWGRATLVVPAMDYCGMTMLHCHIVEHEDIGMMGVWEIM